MESDHEGKPKGKDVAPPMSDYGMRAATALNQILPGAHRDKTVARLFGVSVRMAKYLRAGEHWTTARLGQASSVLGVTFDRALYSPVPDEQHYSEMRELTERLARLEGRLEEMVRGGDARLAHEGGEEADKPRLQAPRKSG